MSMSNPVEATLALDALPMGARVVACGVEEDGTGYGVLFEHQALASGRRYWKDRTNGEGTAHPASYVINTFDDMVIAFLPDPQPADACQSCGCRPRGDGRYWVGCPDTNCSCHKADGASPLTFFDSSSGSKS